MASIFDLGIGKHRMQFQRPSTAGCSRAFLTPWMFLLGRDREMNGRTTTSREPSHIIEAGIDDERDYW
ncbi:hypothetical protein AGABI2DRAFT_194029 [Agaricus bisporus var. bisporus H97]|uniref:hypothetical protein n=1 Tax=Agaricus bisporus var. bisporus (strain H97 / ATCC MYA-4626 / FGSC 10389) TaxID=936046 RepID=UPI00029F58BB|nr:hypothetical protein AGABI2DRAFT_194029 [Agaricus bisporus var. bisporus H97]EKV46168.1 hypothetical protein AGABI2DRAFT_194029 [Agaricus bisporus var. bisporus H97]